MRLSSYAAPFQEASHPGQASISSIAAWLEDNIVDEASPAGRHHGSAVKLQSSACVTALKSGACLVSVCCWLPVRCVSPDEHRLGCLPVLARRVDCWLAFTTSLLSSCRSGGSLQPLAFRRSVAPTGDAPACRPGALTQGCAAESVPHQGDSLPSAGIAQGEDPRAEHACMAPNSLLCLWHSHSLPLCLPATSQAQQPAWPSSDEASAICACILGPWSQHTLSSA